MAKYSLELRDIYNDKNFNLFDFPYPFYEEGLKKQFEEKFFQWYMFDEIGFPTIGYFKQRLKATLIKIMPYYIKLYATEIAAKDINFLLNKDLKETFIRELENSSNVNSTGTLNGNTNNTSEGTNNSEINDNVNNNNTVINSDTPQGSISDIEKYMSTATKDSSTATQQNNSNSAYEGTNNSIYENNSKTNAESLAKGTEKTELVSQGNIGVTSSAELLEKWRKTIINIDELILNDLNNLFMQVY